MGMAWMFIALVFSTCIALIGLGYNEAFGLPGVTGLDGSSERVFLALTTVLFHPVFSGFMLAAVMAAVMSTADSQLLVLSSALTEDLPFCKNMTEKKKSWVSRFGVVGFAVLAYIIAANGLRLILGFRIASSFLSIILVSKFTQRPSDELLKKLKFELE